MSSLKIFILFFISSLSILSHAQTTDRTPYMSNVQLEYHNQEYKHSNPIDYKHSNEWKKYKTLRAIGWSALGVGIPTTLFGVVLSAFQNSLSGSGGVHERQDRRDVQGSRVGHERVGYIRRVERNSHRGHGVPARYRG